jgi:hypothetical protein
MGDTAAFDSLLTLSEIGVGLVGFAALVLAITRPDAPLNAEQTFQLRELVRSGLVSALLALLPIGLGLAGLAAPNLWRLVSGCHVIFLILATAAVNLERRTVPPEERQQPFAVLILVVAVAMFLLQLGNAVGWPAEPSPAPYFFAVVLGLVISGAYFMRLLFARLL